MPRPEPTQAREGRPAPNPRRLRDLDESRQEGGPRDKARDVVLHWTARRLWSVGVRPNHLTLAQVPIYLWMIYAGFTGRYVTFGLLQLVIMVLDGMDGTVARRMGVQSRAGAYLDASFDLFGIVLVMVVALHAHPSYSVWLVLLLLTNLLLYWQNYALDEKAVSYVRGPVVIGIYLELQWPGVFLIALLVPLVTTVVILAVRAAVTPAQEPPGASSGPPPHRPGFKAPPGPPRDTR